MGRTRGPRILMQTSGGDVLHPQRDERLSWRVLKSSWRRSSFLRTFATPSTSLRLHFPCLRGSIRWKKKPNPAWRVSVSALTLAFGNKLLKLKRRVICGRGSLLLGNCSCEEFFVVVVVFSEKAENRTTYYVTQVYSRRRRDASNTRERKAVIRVSVRMFLEIWHNSMFAGVDTVVLNSG